MDRPGTFSAAGDLARELSLQEIDTRAPQTTGGIWTIPFTYTIGWICTLSWECTFPHRSCAL